MNDHYQIPPAWLLLLRQFPLLLEVSDWQLLRKWSLSEVWRITTQAGKTWIAKGASGSQASELEIYLHVLAPLQIKQPALHSFVETEHGHFFILEDLGGDTLEQQPQPALFLEAAKALARVRATATRHLYSSLPPISPKYVISPPQHLNDLAFLL